MGEEYKRFQEADYLRKMGEQGMGLAKSVARGVPQMATGLVDLAAMPFEAAGVLQPGQAVGSTKWLESKGYLPEQQEGFANQLTELLSGGFDPSDLVTKGAPLLMGVGKTVWHGSPHTFDKFDLSKIGTGEGAQAYGHGLYFADARPTAEGYRDALATEIRVGDKPLLKANKTYPTGVEVLDTDLIASHGNFREASKNLLDSIDELRAIDPNHPEIKTYQSMLADLRKYRPETTVENTGSLYKVDLPDEQIAKMLDWDKPLSQQAPEVQSVLQKYNQFSNYEPAQIGYGKNAFGLVDKETGFLDTEAPSFSSAKEANDFINNPLASNIYQSMSGGVHGPYQAEASKKLYEAGIPGIQYLDQASRGAGDGTRNYVVFSDEIPQILERNNIPVNK